jgi:MFS family permease
MFYSNTIFANAGLKASTITGLVGIVNFVATLFGMILLGMFGRKTLMFVMNVLMAIDLVGLGVFSLKGSDYNNEMIACTMLFITLFEFSSGPIVWLYMSEIMQDKAVSVGTVLNWVINLIISLSIPTIVKEIGDDNIGYIFIFVGGCTAMGALFIAIFMKETKGKTQSEIEDLFIVDKEYTKGNMNKKILDDASQN